MVDADVEWEGGELNLGLGFWDGHSEGQRLKEDPYGKV
jgi:hypothetical protein